MADVKGHHRPAIDTWCSQAERFTRQYDRGLRWTIAALGMLLIWVVVADWIISVPVLTYTAGTWTNDPLSVANFTSRGEARLFHRVLSMLDEVCEPHETVFAADISVDGVPFARRVARICDMELNFVNPVVSAFGDSEVTCVDELNGKITAKPRRYPVTINNDGEYRTFTDIGDVCNVWQTVDCLRQ